MVHNDYLLLKIDILQCVDLDKHALLIINMPTKEHHKNSPSSQPINYRRVRILFLITVLVRYGPASRRNSCCNMLFIYSNYVMLFVDVTEVHFLRYNIKQPFMFSSYQGMHSFAPVLKRKRTLQRTYAEFNDLFFFHASSTQARNDSSKYKVRPFNNSALLFDIINK